MAQWLRFTHAGATHFGTLDGDAIRVFDGDLFDAPRATGRCLSIAEVRLLAPVQPSKVLALWNNFGQLARKLGLATPSEPLYLIKPPNTYLEPGGVIRKPLCDGKVAFEGELGIVIGKTARSVPQEQALGHVFGYTCANDVTVNDIIRRDPSFAQWVRAKGFDTFCPVGPWIETDLDPRDLSVKCIVDGQVRQDGRTSQMMFDVPALIAYVSRAFTLEPGDLILTGTPEGVGPLAPGNRVTVAIETLGELTVSVSAPG